MSQQMPENQCAHTADKNDIAIHAYRSRFVEFVAGLLQVALKHAKEAHVLRANSNIRDLQQQQTLESTTNAYSCQLKVNTLANVKDIRGV